MLLQYTLDDDVWNDWCDELEVDCPYYSLAYARIWEREERGASVGIRFEDRHGAVLYPVLRVPLEPLTGGSPHVDIRTAYDFGGPLPVSKAPEATLEAFDRALRPLFSEWGVVTEFARLHPFARVGSRGASTELDPSFVVDFGHSLRAIRKGYHSSFRRNLRKARRNELEAEVLDDPCPTDVRRFHEMYLETMRYVGARDFYFFSLQTIQELCALPEMRLVAVRHGGATIAAALVLRSAGADFYYLGCSDKSQLDLRPNHLLFDTMIADGIQRGARCLHLGGGPESLRRFKAQMANATAPYRQVRRIHQPATYERLSTRFHERSGMFPAYHCELIRTELPEPTRARFMPVGVG